jgi:hypothetical protein
VLPATCNERNENPVAPKSYKLSVSGTKDVDIVPLNVPVGPASPVSPRSPVDPVDPSLPVAPVAILDTTKPHINGLISGCSPIEVATVNT